jgi:hypothetical protein
VKKVPKPGERVWWHRVGRFLDEWHDVEWVKIRNRGKQPMAVILHRGIKHEVLLKHIHPRKP